MPHLRCFLTLLVAPCAVLIEASPATVRPSGHSERKILLPNGIADGGGRTGFFTNPRGGIDAVDMTTGDLLWETIEAEVPVQVVEGRLIAQAGTRRNRLRILIFDLTRRGECVFESDVAVFPDWVVTGEAPGHSFVSHWQVEQTRLLLDWEARAWPVGKRSLSESRAAPVKHAHGQAIIDLGSGQVRMIERPAPVPPPSCSGLALLQGLAVQWHGEVGGQIKAVALTNAPPGSEAPKPDKPAAAEPTDGKARALSALESWREAANEDPDARAVKKLVAQDKLVLYSWDAVSHRLLSVKTLCVGQRLRVRATLDEHYLCVRQGDPAPTETDMHGPRNDPWRVFDLKTGALHGRIPHEPGMSSLVLLGRRVCYTVPEPIRGRLEEPTRQLRALKVVDLHSGQLLWQRVVGGKLLTVPAP